LSETVGFITEAQKPEIFFITSVIALIAIYQLHQILTDHERYVKKPFSIGTFKATWC
jgi:hypothetical protein